MTPRSSAEEQKLASIVQRLPFEEEEKKRWTETINESGLSEDIAKEIRARMSELPRQEEQHLAVRQARDTAEVKSLIQRWRLQQNLPAGGRRR
jgi:hypothetical protein